VRFIPSWFPGAGFKRYARSITTQLARFEDVPFDWAKKRIVCASVWVTQWLLTSFCQLSGHYVESFLSKHLVEESGLCTDPLKQDYVKWACEALYLGGGDTVMLMILQWDAVCLTVTSDCLSSYDLLSRHGTVS
jgi:hypothetical protein